MKNILINAKKTGKDLDITRHSIGQGGVSGEPTFDKNQYEVRNLRPKLIRLFIADWQKVYMGKNKYNWELLDKNVKNILECGAKPVMCICFKPHELFPVYDQRITDPNDYSEWEHFIFELVKRYKEDGVTYWEVANEPDIGEAGGRPYLFTPQGYCYYYRRTVSAIKKANPEAKVGGPALAFYTSKILPEFLKYCKKEKLPLDFVSWHMYNDDPEEFKKSILFVKKLLIENKLKCETTMNEWNAAFGGSLFKHLKNPGYQPCFIIAVINNMLEAGLSHSCHYHIRNLNFKRESVMNILSERSALDVEFAVNYFFNLLGVFDHQGIIRPSYFSFKLLSRLIGKQLIFKNPAGNVKALAAYNAYEDQYNVLIWNFAVKKPKKEKVTLKISGLKKNTYHYKRYLLQARCAGNDEENRLKVIKYENTKEIREFKDTFELKPYGVTGINLAFNKKNKLVLY